MSDFVDWLETELTEAGRRPRRRFPPALEGLRAGLALALVLALCVAVPVLLLSRRHREYSSAPTATHGVDPQLVANLEVLRRPRRPSDARVLHRPDPFPPKVPYRDLFGPLRREARVVRLPHDGLARIVPGRHGLCLEFRGGDTGGGAFCTPTTTILKRGGLVFTPGGASASGILPDRFVRLSTLAPDGATRPVALSEGVFSTSYPPGGCLLAQAANGETTVIPVDPGAGGRCGRGRPAPTHPAVTVQQPPPRRR